MSEFRQDRTTGAFVIVAPGRGLRPFATARHGQRPEPPHPFDPNCPFCPGHEQQLPGILTEVPDRAPPGWQLRVVPNKFPAVLSPLERGAQKIGPHLTMPGDGQHDVIIESPRHDANPSLLSDDHMRALASLYQRRFAELSALPGIKTVILFRNHGAAAGASLPHPHSQIIALAMTPPRLRAISDWMQQRWQETGRCVTCDELKAEEAEGRRVVESTQAFLAVVPFAASVPFETWIVPRRHQASFTDMSEAECADFGRILRNALQRIRSACGDPPYNFAVESFDCLAAPAPHAHWRLRIVPDLVRWGGFELASGVPINPSEPEANADLLRSAPLHDPNE